MKKYWYVVQKKTGGEYLIGFCYGNSELGELVLLDSMEQYCEEKEYRLCLLVEIIPMLHLSNQIYPEKMTDEARECLSYVMQATGVK